MSTAEELFPDDTSSGSKKPSPSYSRTLSLSSFSKITGNSTTTDGSSLDDDTRILLEKENQDCLRMKLELDLLKEKLENREFNGSLASKQMLDIREQISRLVAEIQELKNNQFNLQEEVNGLKVTEESACLCSLF